MDEDSLSSQLKKLITALKSRVQECKQRASGAGGPSTSLLMTQLASDVLHSLAEQVLTVRKPSIQTLASQENLGQGESLRRCRETLLAIDKKIKELITKLQQNQTLMSKSDFQLCMLHANQLANLNYQRLAAMETPLSPTPQLMYATATRPQEAVMNHIGMVSRNSK